LLAAAAAAKEMCFFLRIPSIIITIISGACIIYCTVQAHLLLMILHCICCSNIMGFGNGGTILSTTAFFFFLATPIEYQKHQLEMDTSSVCCLLEGA
jgi:hypothetical protein